MICTTVGLLLIHPTPPFVFLPTKTLNCPKYSPIKCSLALVWSIDYRCPQRSSHEASKEVRPGQGRFLLMPSWRHDLYWLPTTDWVFAPHGWRRVVIIIIFFKMLCLQPQLHPSLPHHSKFNWVWWQFASPPTVCVHVWIYFKTTEELSHTFVTSLSASTPWSPQDGSYQATYHVLACQISLQRTPGQLAWFSRRVHCGIMAITRRFETTNFFTPGKKQSQLFTSLSLVILLDKCRTHCLYHTKYAAARWIVAIIIMMIMTTMTK
jgi:hypothetical protein